MLMITALTAIAAFVAVAPERATIPASAVAASERVAAEQQAAKQWEDAPAMMIDPREPIVATISTNHGNIVLELRPEFAPRTVNNFVFLATEDFYDGVIFHRVIDEFMIQGGDPTGTGRGGPGYRFYDEVVGNPLIHEKYVISMANAGANTNGSQFFITDTETPHLNGRHTVFGKVIEGTEVVDAISEVAKGAGDRPVEDVVIEDVIVPGYTDGDDHHGDDHAEAPATQPAE